METVLAPVFVTGTGPTSIPSAALGMPILGTFLTCFVCTAIRALFSRPPRHLRAAPADARDGRFPP